MSSSLLPESLDDLRERYNSALAPLLQPTAVTPQRKLPGHTFVNSSTAAQLDADLMSTEGYTLDQLMELAGLSCAEAICKMYPREAFPEVCVLCGPGNNGGDGLVCARHLTQFDYRVTVVYPPHAKQDKYMHLITQCKANQITVVENFYDSLQARVDLVVDAIFGFSFNGDKPIKEPYATMIQQMISLQNHVPVVAIDVPSGWRVDDTTLRVNPFPGEPHKLATPTYTALLAQLSYMPDMLISLSVPKLCASLFLGRFHMLGGRFIPKRIAFKYRLRLPSYVKAEQSVLIDAPQHHEIMARRGRQLNRPYAGQPPASQDPLPVYFSYRSQWPVDKLLEPYLEPSNALLTYERPLPHPVRNLGLRTPAFVAAVNSAAAGEPLPEDHEQPHAYSATPGLNAPGYDPTPSFEAYQDVTDVTEQDEGKDPPNTKQSGWSGWDAVSNPGGSGPHTTASAGAGRSHARANQVSSDRPESIYSHVFTDDAYDQDPEAQEFTDIAQVPEVVASMAKQDSQTPHSSANEGSGYVEVSVSSLRRPLRNLSTTTSQASPPAQQLPKQLFTTRATEASVTSSGPQLSVADTQSSQPASKSGPPDPTILKSLFSTPAAAEQAQPPENPGGAINKSSSELALPDWLDTQATIIPAPASPIPSLTTTSVQHQHSAPSVAAPTVGQPHPPLPSSKSVQSEQGASQPSPSSGGADYASLSYAGAARPSTTSTMYPEGITSQPFYHPDADRNVARNRLLEAGGVGHYLFRPCSSTAAGEENKFVLCYLTPNERAGEGSSSSLVLVNVFIWAWRDGFTRDADRTKCTLYTSIPDVVSVCMRNHVKDIQLSPVNRR